MTIGSRHLVTGLLLALAWGALIAIDITLMIKGALSPNPLHTLTVGLLLLASVIILQVITYSLVRRDVADVQTQMYAYVERIDRRLDALRGVQVEHATRLEAVTEEIPKLRAVTVYRASAVVPRVTVNGSSGTGRRRRGRRSTSKPKPKTASVVPRSRPESESETTYPWQAYLAGQRDAENNGGLIS